MGKLPRDLGCYLKRIKAGDSEAEEELISAHLSDALMIITHDPYHDKILQPHELAKKALQAFITKIKKGQITELTIKKGKKPLRDTIKEIIREHIHSQLKKISEDVYKGNAEAEKQFLSYETNILNIVERNWRNLLDHIKVSQKVISEFLAHIQKNAGADILNFHAFLNTMIKNRAYDQYRHESHMENFPDNSPDDPPAFKCQINDPRDTFLDQIHIKKMSTILSNLILILNPLEMLILDMSYKQEKRLREIVQELSILNKNKIIKIKARIDEPFVWRIRHKALQKLLDGLKQKGINNIDVFEDHRGGDNQ